MRELLLITKALADDTRLRALGMLTRAEELCLCQIIEVLNLAPSTVSRHMTLLYEAGLVDRRKQGRWHYFRLSSDEHRPAWPATRQTCCTPAEGGEKAGSPNAPAAAAGRTTRVAAEPNAAVVGALAWVLPQIAATRQHEADTDRLRQVMSQDLEELCACYRS